MRGPSLSAFTPERSSELPGPDWLRRRRADAADRFAGASLPTPAEDTWRYAPLSRLDLDRYEPAGGGHPAEGTLPAEALNLLTAVGAAAAVIVLHNGRLVGVDLRDEAVRAGLEVETTDGDPGLLEIPDRDAFDDLHDAFVPEIVVLRLPSNALLTEPVVIVNHADAERGASFPHVVVDAGTQAEATVIDLWTSAPVDAFTSPVVELRTADAANLRYVQVQDVARSVWQVGRLLASPGRDATIKAWTAAVGGDYARLYVSAVLPAVGSTAAISGIYVAEGDQTIDFRSLQTHSGPRSRSDFVLKGTVADRAHGIYTGLIKVLQGAKSTDSFLTNRNLVLSEGASVDSIPNLEIVNENDLRSCGHAAATGPVDEEHLFYLESRGVPPDVAERLVVFGFLDEVVAGVPAEGLRDELRRMVAGRLQPEGVRG